MLLVVGVSFQESRKLRTWIKNSHGISLVFTTYVFFPGALNPSSLGPSSQKLRWVAAPVPSGGGSLRALVGIVGFSPHIIHFNKVFHYKPSILGYPYFWKHPNDENNDLLMGQAWTKHHTKRQHLKTLLSEPTVPKTTWFTLSFWLKSSLQ